MEMKKSDKNLRPHLDEELARYIIERVKESCTEEDGEELYKEVLIAFAPYIFTKYTTGEAMILMETILRKAKNPFLSE